MKKKYFINGNIVDPHNNLNEVGGLIIGFHSSNGTSDGSGDPYDMFRSTSFAKIVDNAGGYLMQHGQVDLVIVGSDRITRLGDVCNKIGTYLKALAAKDNNVPFYVALPSSTIDWNIENFKDIPIEERNSEELSHMEGLDESNKVKKVRIYPKKSKTMNLAFDVTPAKYVTGLITEKGICEASKEGLKKLFK